MAGRGPLGKPDDQRARRNAVVPMARLPRAGRRGATPPWPLLDDVKLKAQLSLEQAKHRAAVRALDDEGLSKREQAALQRKVDASALAVAVLRETLRQQRKLEAALWAKLWHTPQAVMWDRGHCTPWEVAQYVRLTILGQLGDLDSTKEARQWSDRIGLNAQAMTRLRWEVEPLSDAAPSTAADAGTGRAAHEPAAAAGARARFGDLRVVEGGAADAVAGA